MHQASAQSRDSLADQGNTPDTSGAGTPTGGNCAHCGICHLAGTGYLPTVAHIAPLVVPARLAPVARITLIDGITSPPLDHPPRTLV